MSTDPAAFEIFYAGRFEDRLLAAILANYDGLTRPAPGLALAPARPAGQQARAGHGPVHVQAAAYVVHRMQAALAGSHAVLRTSDHAPDSQTGKPVWDLIWSSGASKTDRIVDLAPDGHPVTGYLVTTCPHRTISIVIHYRARTGSARSTRSDRPPTPPARRPGPAPRRSTPAQDAAGCG